LGNKTQTAFSAIASSEFLYDFEQLEPFSLQQYAKSARDLLVKLTEEPGKTLEGKRQVIALCSKVVTQ